MKRRGLILTQSEIMAHAAKNGLDLDPALRLLPPPPNGVDRGGLFRAKEGQDTTLGVKSREKTHPERCMEAILQAGVKTGKFLTYGYEEITLKIGEPRCRFTADFHAITPDGHLQFLEVKGPFIREDSLVKFKSARKQYPHFEFELWQFDSCGAWKQLI